GNDQVVRRKVQRRNLVPEQPQAVLPEGCEFADAAVAGDEGQAAAPLEVGNGSATRLLVPPAQQPGNVEAGMRAERIEHGVGAADVAVAGTLHAVQYLHAQAS